MDEKYGAVICGNLWQAEKLGIEKRAMTLYRNSGVKIMKQALPGYRRTCWRKIPGADYLQIRKPVSNAL
jgi:hypothetical protein